MNMHYDFLVFEFVHHLKHHKKDVFLIAKMLKHGGFNVAILDVFDEYEEKNVDGIDVIRILHSYDKPNDKYLNSPKNVLYNFIHFYKYIYQQYRYMNEVVGNIEDMADSFYCGSYNYFMPSNFFNLKKHVFFWGLRSYYFDNNTTGMAPYFDLRKFYLKWKFRRNQNNGLFISNNIIKKELLALGIDNKQMVIREERCIFMKSNTYNLNIDSKFNLLIIGKLRRSKCVVESIAAYKAAHLKNSTLFIMGKSMYDYENEIQKAIDGDSNIVRKNQYLEECDFDKAYRKAHFVVFGDKQEKYTITNGTFLEALINYRPVIVPNYEPYKYYVNKYKVGILYDPNVRGSLSEALIVAQKKSAMSFFLSIKSFLKTLEFEVVADKFSENIRNIIS